MRLFCADACKHAERAPARSFTDTWTLATEPALSSPLDDLVVYGLCTQQDLFVEDRLRFAEQMRDIQLEHQVRARHALCGLRSQV